MAFRLNVFTTYLLLTVAFVLSAKNSGKLNKNKSNSLKLSENINKNPFLQSTTSSSTLSENINSNWFLQNRSTTIPANGRNPFLLSISMPFSSSSNGNNQNQNASKNNKVSETIVNRSVVFNKHNLFLQGTPNADNRVQTDSSINSNIDTTELRMKISTSRKESKSEQKCKEYEKQFSRTTEISPLVGNGSDVFTITSRTCISENPLIVGGVTASPGEFPHMVALGITTDGKFTSLCGGTLIAPEWVLSAAHCITKSRLTDARIGIHDLRNNEQGSIRTTINSVKKHPRYIPPAMYNDIALVKLNTVITFTAKIRPACLYQSFGTAPKKAWISGWGVTEYEGEFSSNLLQKAELNIISNLDCARNYSANKATMHTQTPYGIAPSMICAEGLHFAQKKDSCQGDSGGPLQIISKDSCLFEVVGIISFGEICAGIKPGVYTRVSHFLEWIEDTVWP